MPFTVRDLRYSAEQSYPVLYAYLHRNAQRFLGALKYDAFEVDMVIGHVVEQLVRLGVLGGKNDTPKTALDTLTDAQFYTFLCRSVRNKAIDRLRKRRLQISTVTELDPSLEEDGDYNPLDDAVESLWGEIPFSTPEDITLHLASQRDLRNLLKHCIQRLSAAPQQLQAVAHELQDIGADDLLDELGIEISEEPNPHMSQHKDHAHKKLRACLQQQSSNLTVLVALRLTIYTKLSPQTRTYITDISTLAQPDMTEEAVREGLQQLVNEGLLTWSGDEVVSITAAQRKQLSRFYREE